MILNECDGVYENHPYAYSTDPMDDLIFESNILYQ